MEMEEVENVREITEDNRLFEKQDSWWIEKTRRHGLFLHIKEDSAEKQNLFTQVIPKTFDLGDAKGEGDCFYDACAQELNEIFETEEYSLKGLRLLCHTYAVELDRRCGGNPNHADNWIAQAFNDSARYQQYLANVQYTVQEREAGHGLGDDRLATWGEPYLDGKIICKVLKIKLHVIEVRENPDDVTKEKQKFIVSHNVVDESRLKNVDEKDVDWEDKKTIHIAVCNLHFVPILKRTTLQKSQPDKESPDCAFGDEIVYDDKELAIEEFENLIRSVANNAPIRSISLNRCKLNNESARMLLGAIQYNSYIIRIAIEGNPISSCLKSDIEHSAANLMERRKILKQSRQDKEERVPDIYSDDDITTYVRMNIRFNPQFKGFADECEYRLKGIFADTGVEYIVCFMPAIDSFGKALPVDYFLDKTKFGQNELAIYLQRLVPHLDILKTISIDAIIGYLENNRLKHSSFELVLAVLRVLEEAEFSKEYVEKYIDDLNAKNTGHDLFDEIAEFLLRDETHIKILFPFNLSLFHWVVGEIQLHKFKGEIKVNIFFHDPYGNRDMDFAKVMVLQETIRNRVLDILPTSMVVIAPARSPYLARQDSEDSESCGRIVAEDILDRIQGIALKSSLYTVGSSELVKEQVRKMQDFLRPNDPALRGFVERRQRKVKLLFSDEMKVGNIELLRWKLRNNDLPQLNLSIVLVGNYSERGIIDNDKANILAMRLYGEGLVVVRENSDAYFFNSSTQQRDSFAWFEEQKYMNTAWAKMLMGLGGLLNSELTDYLRRSSFTVVSDTSNGSAFFLCNFRSPEVAYVRSKKKTSPFDLNTILAKSIPLPESAVTVLITTVIKIPAEDDCYIQENRAVKDLKFALVFGNISIIGSDGNLLTFIRTRHLQSFFSTYQAMLSEGYQNTVGFIQHEFQEAGGPGFTHMAYLKGNLVVVCVNNNLMVFDFGSLKNVSMLRHIHESPVSAFAMNSTGRVFTGHLDGAIKIWGIDVEFNIFYERGVCAQPLPVVGLSFLLNGDFISSNSNGTTTIWSNDPLTGQARLAEKQRKYTLEIPLTSVLLPQQTEEETDLYLKQIRMGGEITCNLVFNNVYVFGHRSGTLTFVEPQDLKTFCEIKRSILFTATTEQMSRFRQIHLPVDNRPGLTTMAYLWDNFIILSLTKDLVVFNLRDFKQHIRVVDAHQSVITTICVNSEKNIFTGDYEGVVKIWRVTEEKDISCLREFSAHQKIISGFSFLPNGDFISGSYDRTAIIWSWDGDNWKESKILRHGDYVKHVVTSPQGDVYVAGSCLHWSEDRAIRQWKYSPRLLTPDEFLAMLREVKLNVSLTSLSLDHYDFKNSSIIAEEIAHLVRTHPTLRRISLRNTGLNTNLISPILKALESNPEVELNLAENPTLAPAYITRYHRIKKGKSEGRKKDDNDKKCECFAKCSDPSKVYVYVWAPNDQGNRGDGHISLRTYGSQGVYASFYPDMSSEQNRKSKPMQRFFKSFPAKFKDFDSDHRRLGCPEIFIFHNLNFQKINDSFLHVSKGKVNWSLVGSSLFRGSTLNCTSFVLWLLYEGGFNELIADLTSRLIERYESTGKISGEIAFESVRIAGLVALMVVGLAVPGASTVTTPLTMALLSPSYDTGEVIGGAIGKKVGTHLDPAAGKLRVMSPTNVIPLLQFAKKKEAEIFQKHQPSESQLRSK
ncbi:MAG: hypothetical protein SFW07_06655 [Gammaproteobacteria bacterium]|nr:hypothetical protein [Gammaproteobacteria bacterium]